MVMECKVTACKSHYPKDVPFEVPKGWEWLRGNDIFLPMESISPQGDFFDYIDIESIDNKRNIVSSPKHLPVKDAPSRATRLVRKGDVLFSMVRPYLRNIARVESNGFIASTGFYVCRCSCAIDSEYCLYLMLSEYVVDGLNQFMKGDNSPSINNSHITSWIYPIPPIAEQRRICEKIDSLFSLTDSLDREQALLQNAVGLCRRTVLDLAIRGKLVPQNPSEEPAIELLRRINPAFKASDNLHYMNSLPVGWVTARLGDIIEIISGTSYRKTDITATTRGLKILRGGNIQNGQIILRDDDVYISDKLINERVNVKKGDIVLVASTGSSELIGKAAISLIDYPRTQIGAFLRIIRSRSRELSDYLGIIFQSELYKSHIREVAKGTNINNIKASYLTEFIIPIPPLAEQRRIIEKIRSLFAILSSLLKD